MPADRAVEDDQGGEPGSSGGAPTAPPAPDATEERPENHAEQRPEEHPEEHPEEDPEATDPEPVATASGTYPRPDGTEEPSAGGGTTAASAASGATEVPAPAGGDRGPEHLVGRPLSYESRWNDIQARFVDEPRGSVTDAESLVAEVIDEIAAEFASARAHLEDQWSRGDEVSTEDLRQAFRRYRSFFQRLLTT